MRYSGPVLAVVCCLLVLRAGFADDTARDGVPQSPVAAEETLRHFELHPDCRIELVASEPDVIDPVHIAFDAEGRMWVVEYSDYPNGPAEGEPGRCRIRVLTRTGEGRYGNPQIFAERLTFATGLMHWMDGVLVTTQSSLIFLRDSDGDGRADQQEEWFRGFEVENPQLRANHPTLGMDNRIYIASGLRGGNVVAVRSEWAGGAMPVSLSGRDFRFDPFTGEYEAISGAGQFGFSFDDWGNRFLCSNRNPCDHVVLDETYLRRNPKLAVSRVVENVSPAGEESRVFPISRFWTTSNLHAGQFTAACGVCIYRGNALPEEFYGNVFVCEPTGNLVHRAIMSPEGASFTSKPDREGVEFLATRDEWFRPVNLKVGPDGALYVVDMYRAVIEHPQFMPEELQKRPDLTYGNDRGRIYRIVAATAEAGGDARPASEESVALRPAQASREELVALLDHSNSWQRDTAHRLILERRDAAMVPLLKQMAARSGSPRGKVHALWLLESLGALDTELLQGALDDRHPRVAEQAVRLAESRFAQNGSLVRKVMEIADRSDDAGLVFQAVLSLSAAPWTPEQGEALARATLRHGTDDWIRTAVAISTGDHAADVLVPLLTELRNQDEADRRNSALTVRELAGLVGMRGDLGEMERCLSAAASVSDADCRSLLAVCMLGLAEGNQRGGRRWTELASQWPSEITERLNAVYRDCIRCAEAFARDSKAESEADALRALSLLEFAPWETAREPVMEFATGSAELRFRVAAIEIAGRRGDGSVLRTLLESYPSQTPAARSAILAACFRSAEHLQLLFDEIESGRIPPHDLDPTRAQQLREHGNTAVRERAVRLLIPRATEDRQQVLSRYQSALSLEANPERGRDIFKNTCAQCHRIGELGVNVAPDISDTRVKTREQLLVDILDPNRAIDANYFSFTIVDLDGVVHTGVIAAETATSVTLRQPEGKEVTLLRSDIEELRSGGVSLMPAGLEEKLSLQDMADLLSFLKNWRYLNGSVPREVIR